MDSFRTFIDGIYLGTQSIVSPKDPKFIEQVYQLETIASSLEEEFSASNATGENLRLALNDKSFEVELDDFF